MNETYNKCDVLIVGGGPAGTTAACLLRERQRSVVVLDKDKHPRFHIGESLLPYNLPLFDRLGVTDAIARIGVTKRGADFTRLGDQQYRAFRFGFGAGPDQRFAFQIKRSEFDEILLRNAEARGATVLQQTRARDIVFADDGSAEVTAESADGRASRWRARFVIDASGRDTWLGNRLGLKQRHARHNSAAMFAHFTGVARRGGDEEGNISIYWFDRGWIWIIPLIGGRTSIGCVTPPQFLAARGGSDETFFLAMLRRCPGVAERIAGAQLVMPPVATGNYSYFSRRMHGDNYILVGDAYAFVDPMFSSGVYLAMDHAEHAAVAVDRVLAGAKPARAFAPIERRMRRGLGRFSWFIYRFTSPAIQFMFTNPSEVLGMRRAVFRVLAGDVFARNPGLAVSVLAFRCVYYGCILAFWRDSRRHRRMLAEAARA